MFIQARQLMALAVVFVSMVFIPVSATIIDVPDDYSSIQAGINASIDGDTVLVAEGHYCERIIFYGKGILLTSEFMWDGDTMYIQNTIIDADTLVLGVADTGSVVCFVNGEDSASVIQGFTIQNGIGTIISINVRQGGGIFCDESSPTISNNTIAGNYANHNGGGINCRTSSPIINNNTISENSADDGGGIVCWANSSPTISNNTISENSAFFGGGIYCNVCSPNISNNEITENFAGYGGGIGCWSNSSPNISNNTISGNSAGVGGGIYCNVCSPTISINTISGNSANHSGGGIYCRNNSSPIISNNEINGNFASHYGGGIGCWSNSSPNISNNTISGNSVDFGGGISCRYYSDPIIVNTIFWDNTAESAGNEIYLDSTSSISITFSDIQDGWTGEGNIDDDPLFIDPDNDDFHLQAGSPCIDTGDPNSPFDPDSTRADMGAFYFDQHAGIRESLLLPLQFSLSQNYPNPFNPTTTISFTIERPQFVTLKVYDLLGREVQTLVDENRQAGLHNIAFDGSDLSSGIYFYRLQTGDIAESKRMVLLK